MTEREVEMVRSVRACAVPLRAFLLLLAVACAPVAPPRVATTTAASSAVRDTVVPLAPEVRAALTTVREHVTRLVDSGGVPSVVVVVASRGRTVWAEPFGWADREARRPATLATPYRVASVTKSITATGVMQLAGRGVVDLDAGVGRWLARPLPVMRGNADGLTLRRLLAMTGGVPHYWQFVPLADGTTALSPAEQVARYAVSVFPPGEVYHYSNLAYGAAGEVAAAAAHRPWADLLRDSLFLPLGMTTARLLTDARAVEGAAIGYDGQGRPMAPVGFAPPGGAGVIASAADLMRFAELHLGHARASGVLADSLVHALHLKPPAGDPGVIDAHRAYANGWGLIDAGTPHAALLSDGALEGTAATILLLPAADVAIVVVTNATGGPANDLAFDIAGRLVPGFQAALAEAMRAAEETDRPRPLAGDAALAGRWEGRIVAPDGGGARDTLPFTLEIDREGRARAAIAGAAPTAVSDPRREASLVMGRFHTALPVRGPIGEATDVELELRLDGAELYGIARAIKPGPIGAGFGIPMYATLRRR